MCTCTLYEQAKLSLTEDSLNHNGLPYVHINCPHSSANVLCRLQIECGMLICVVLRRCTSVPFSHHCRELVSLLHLRGVVVYLVSGGFRKIIEPFAEHLRIPKENIFANRLLFGADGMFINHFVLNKCLDRITITDLTAFLV